VLGYACKRAIHPTQIAVINSVFTISEQIATACRVVAAFDQAGGGACQMEGRMVDVAVVKCARRTVAVAARVAVESPNRAKGVLI
jgi:citrate lyase beta subunit